MTGGQNEAWVGEQLRSLATVLQQMDYQTHLLEPSPRVPYPVLLLRLPLPGERPPLELALSFYPISTDEVKHTRLLQYYTELPLHLDAAALARLRDLLPELNNKTVLGHFGVAEGRPVLNYRYVQSLPIAAPITQATVADVVLLVGYTPALFMEMLEHVAREDLSVEQARAQLAAR